MGKRMTTEEFIRKSVLVHGNKYDYSKVNYVRASDKVTIICPIHGEFEQLPFAHFYAHRGCKKCAMEALSSNKPKPIERFIDEATVVHNGKYDYSKVEYVDSKTKVCIICPIHGEFWQTPDAHINQHSGCPKCKSEAIGNAKRSNTSEFIRKAKAIHGDKYDYSLVEYTNRHSEVSIVCPIHGKFSQIPSVHLRGCGCPRCNESILEKSVANALEANGIEFEQRKYYDWLLNENTNHQLTLDFYIPSIRIAIECQGEQHFIEIEHFGGAEKLENTKKRDNLKKRLCDERGVKLVYFLDERFNSYINNNVYFNNIIDLVRYIKGESSN